MYVVIAVLIISAGGVIWYQYLESTKKTDNDPEHKLPAIKIILTNGCGFEGVAGEFSDFLADRNVDIIATGNTRKPIYDKTIIVVRKGDAVDRQRLSRMTGIERYTMALNEYATAEFEIIIGKDYEQYIKK
jgi:hypothetical protein